MSEVLASNPFGNEGPPSVVGALVAAEQQRAIAEVQAALVFARTSPRDPRRCMDAILTECQRATLAEEATYSYVRGGTEVTGPSIRLAETIARNWRNMVAGVKVLSRRDGVSECLAFCWDLESNVREERGFTVRHWRDTKQGGYPLRDERDISELELNIGSRRKRACILALIPGDVTDAAVRQCEYTVNTKIELTPELVADMLNRLAAFGVTREMVEKRIQRRIDAITPANVGSLRRIYTSLRDGMSTPAEWFEMPADDPAANVAEPVGSSRTASVKSRMKANAKKREPVSKPSAAPRADEPRDKATPVSTYADVADALKMAGSMEALNLAGDLIRSVANEEQRRELSELYSTLAAKFDDEGSQ
ncbi:hypothetical protein [Paraburkholderia sp. HD33-4]|uniref:hypothetical protein n=1 Tax=Paraburkholderia sp. HD33-4 TaxID=2883242 RepID=UPI001F32D4B0|nr:hypothetical protein [Paraburkholderia sp. HD33-4]